MGLESCGAEHWGRGLAQNPSLPSELWVWLSRCGAPHPRGAGLIHRDRELTLDLLSGRCLGEPRATSAICPRSRLGLCSQTPRCWRQSPGQPIPCPPKLGVPMWTPTPCAPHPPVQPRTRPCASSRFWLGLFPAPSPCATGQHWVQGPPWGLGGGKVLEGSEPGSWPGDGPDWLKVLVGRARWQEGSCGTSRCSEPGGSGGVAV